MDADVFDTRLLDPEKAKRDTAIPKFYLQSVRNEEESKKAGKAVYENREFVRITVPGDRLNIVDTFVDDNHRRRWPEHYRAFKEKSEYKPEGYPLQAWPMASPALISTLADASCHTVEQLANMPETGLPKFPEIKALQAKAREFLDAQNDSKAVTRLQATVDKLQAQIEMKDETIKRLQEQLLEFEDSQPEVEPRRRGRPRKVV